MAFTASSRPARIALACLLFSPMVLAAPVPEGLMLDPFPGASVTRAQVLPDTDHAVVIGTVRKVNNRVRAEREVLATGELIRVTFEIPRIHTRAEAFEHARDQLLAKPHSMLFFCEGRECGASSLWANEVLDNARLYAPEENQAYLSVVLEEQPQALVSVYAVTRGNRRVYLHIDQFTPHEPLGEPLYPTPSTMLKLLHANGRLALPGLELGSPEGAGRTDDPETWLHLVNRMLRSDTRVRVAISGKQAPAVMQRLIELDIRASRLEIGEPFPASGVVLDKI